MICQDTLQQKFVHGVQIDFPSDEDLANLTHLKIKETAVRGAVMYAAGDVRVDERPDPRISRPTDAINRLAATCVCGSDLWPYRGLARSTDRPHGA
jgi:hypothetical protein